MRQPKYEIMLMYDRHYTPKGIIAKGYSKQTVYRWKKKWLAACETIEGLK